jgi:signal transduction histidine kinase
MLLLSAPRFSRRGTFFTASVTAVLYVLLSYGVMHSWGDLLYAHPLLDFAWRMADMALLTLAALYLAKQRFGRSFFNVASAYVIVTMIGVLAAALAMVMDLPAFVIRYALYLLCGWLIYLARGPLQNILEQTKKGWWLLCAVPLFLITNFLLLSAVPSRLTQDPSGMPAALTLCGTTAIIYVTLFSTLWEMQKRHRLEQNVMALRLSVSALEHQNELIQQNERRSALFRHDLRHFTKMISDCLGQNDTEGIRELLVTLDQNTSASGGPLRVLMGHAMPDSVLSRYMEEAREAGAEITIRTDTINPIRVDMAELAAVLANALENAVKACRTIPDGIPRSIRLDGRRRGAQYFLEVANTYEGVIEINGETGLPYVPGHRQGLGCTSIAFFAQQYGAALQFQAEDGWFHLRMLI